MSVWCRRECSSCNFDDFDVILLPDDTTTREQEIHQGQQAEKEHVAQWVK